MTSWFWTACGSAAADGFWHPTQSKHSGTPIDRSALPSLKQERVSLDQILLGPSPRPFLLCGEEVLGLGVSSICPAPRARVGPPRLPASASIPRGPRPALPAPRVACRPHRPHSCLAGHCYRRISQRSSRAEAKCILMAAGGRALSSASPGLRSVGLCVACRVSACPWRLPADPAATPSKATKPANHP
jgi:hypothetical protein